MGFRQSEIYSSMKIPEFLWSACFLLLFMAGFSHWLRWIPWLSSQLAYPRKTQRLYDSWCPNFQTFWFACWLVSLHRGCRNSMLPKSTTTGILSFDPCAGYSHVVRETFSWAVAVSLASQSAPESWGETPCCTELHITELSCSVSRHVIYDFDWRWYSTFGSFWSPPSSHWGACTSYRNSFLNTRW